jgi:hypothetical protein
MKCNHRAPSALLTRDHLPAQPVCTVSLTHVCAVSFLDRYEYAFGFGCRWCGEYMDTEELQGTAGIGDSKSLEAWEQAFCEQVTGSGLFPGVQGCRILATTQLA